MKPFHMFGIDIPVWIVDLVAFLAIVAIGWTIKRGVFAWLRKMTSHSDTKLDDAFIAAANFPLTIMICVWSASGVLHYGVPGMPARILNAVNIASKIATLGALILFVDTLIVKLYGVFSSTRSVLRASEAFSNVIIHVVVFSLGGLIILSSLGVSITPFMASLGIGSLAVALALQPTLENIFCGFQILVDAPVLPGHFIKLESGEEGYVEKIGWRTTWIRQLPNSTVIIPNKFLVNARLVNYNYPSSEQAVLVEVGVHYHSDLDVVERVTMEVASQVLKMVPGGLPEFQPFVRFHTLAGSSINFTVILRAQQYTDNFLIKHEFIKALVKRYAQVGITIPYPITALNTTQEKAVLHQ